MSIVGPPHWTPSLTQPLQGRWSLAKQRSGLSWTHLPINQYSLNLISLRAKFQHTIMTTNHWEHHPTFRDVPLRWVEKMCISSCDHTREGAAGVPHTRTRKAACRWRLGAAALPYTLSHGPEPAPMTCWFPPLMRQELENRKALKSLSGLRSLLSALSQSDQQLAHSQDSW